MAEVVFLRHQGVRCALPAQQVTGATQTPEGDPLFLFSSCDTSMPIARCLKVTTLEGPKPLPCEAATFGNIEDGTMLPLSELLAEELSMPHFVGIAAGENEIVWLIDLMRWRSNHE